MYYAVIQNFVKNNITLEMMTPHIEYMKEIQNRGVVVVSGPFSDERRGGMFILNVENEHQLYDIVNNDPAVINGILENDIRTYSLLFERDKTKSSIDYI